ncbi:MAG: hypothetical protein WC661_01995 [Opitutaceae bacterium]|jgi:hypothetical protein
MKKFKVSSILLLMALAIRLVPTASAEEEESKIKIPDTVPAILQAVKTQEDELDQMVTAGKLDHVHEAAFAIRDLVNALADKSTDLPADKLSKIKANAKFVASLADRLDKSGDANDKAATALNFRRLQVILEQIVAQYPAAMPKHDMSGMQGMK